MVSIPAWLPGPMFSLGGSLSLVPCSFWGSLSRGSLYEDPSPELEKRAVRILLECFLVKYLFLLFLSLKQKLYLFLLAVTFIIMPANLFFALFLFHCTLHQSDPFVIMKTINGSLVFDGYVIAILRLLAEQHNFS